MARILGITDEQTSCDCCGREDLKYTVVIEHEDGAVAHYGCVCAGKMLRRDAADIRKEAKRAQVEADRQVYAAAEAKARADFDAWAHWLGSKAEHRWSDGSVNVSRCFEALGGFSVARARFDAERTA